MSAAHQAVIGDGSIYRAAWEIERFKPRQKPAVHRKVAPEPRQPKPPESLAFFRRHTESLLRRYLYASMQVGRAPSILSDPVSRGWASSRPVRTFEDAVIFVLDIEKCLGKLDFLDRELLSRVVLQEYTHAETSALLGMSCRSVSNRLPLALDRLTEKVLEAGILEIPQ